MRMRPTQIMIVDNSLAAAEVTRGGLVRMLGAGLVVVVAPSIEQAWTACVDGEVTVLIVEPSPLNPGALKLLERIRAEALSLSIVVLASYDTPRVRKEISALGIRRYLAKPAELPLLADHVWGAL